MSVDLGLLDKGEVAKLFDFSVLPKQSTEAEVREGCALTRQYGFGAYCLSSGYWIPLVVEELADHPEIKVGAAIAFPWGAVTATAKAFETEEAVRRGATTLDMAMNVSALKSGRLDDVRAEFRDFVAASGGMETKVILEVCFLDDEEIATACNLIAEAGIHYAKTSSGQFEGPSLEQFLIMKKTLVGTPVKLKVAGVKFPRPQNAYNFIMAGADRIGTRAAPEIIHALDQLRELGIVPKHSLTTA